MIGLLFFFISNRWLKLIILLGLVLVVLFGFFRTIPSGSVLYAQMPPTPTPTPIPSVEVPPIALKEAYAFTNIRNPSSNDFFVLVRYELEIGDEPHEYWCERNADDISKYLLNDSGGELEVPNPDFPFSLKADRLSMLYLDSVQCGGSTCPSFPDQTSQHITNLKIPRIGKGLMGLYASSPAGTTYGFVHSLTPGYVCLEYNSQYFNEDANGNQNCQQVVRLTGGTVGLANLISGGEGIMYNLESDLGLPENTLVSAQGLVTPAGQMFLEEAMTGIVNIAKNGDGDTVFQLGTVRPNADFQPVGSRSALQTKINATATASGVSDNLDIISSQYLGFEDGKFFGAILFIMLGLFSMVAISYATQNSLLGVMAGISMTLPGLFIGAISIGFLFTIIALFLIFGSWFWIRRSPE